MRGGKTENFTSESNLEGIMIIASNMKMGKTEDRKQVSLLCLQRVISF